MSNTLDPRYNVSHEAGEILTVAIAFDDKANSYMQGLGSNTTPAAFETVSIPAVPKVDSEDLNFFRVK